MSGTGVAYKLKTPTKRQNNPSILRTPIFTPKTPLTFTPASAVRTSASMGTTNSEDRSSPLLTVTNGNNALDPSLDLMGGIDSDTIQLMAEPDGPNLNVLSPSAIQQLALQTPHPTLDAGEDGQDALLFQPAMLDGDVGTARVLDFDDAKGVDMKEDMVDTALLDEFGESQGTDVGEYGLGAAFDISSTNSPPPSDLVSWLRNVYDHVAPPYDEFTPKIFREDLYAHMARDLPPSATLPSKDQVASLVLEAFPGAKWQSHVDHGPNHVILGLQARRTGNVRSLAQGSRHRYSNSCNLADLANIAAYAHREMTQSTEARDSYSPTESQEMSPTTPAAGSGPFGTPGRRSALDELAAAAALSERSPMAKGRKISYGDEQDGGKTKRRRNNAGKGVTVYPEAGSSRDGWNGDAEGVEGVASSSRAAGKKKGPRAKSSKTNGHVHNANGGGSLSDNDSPPSMMSHIISSSSNPSGDAKGNDSSRTVRGPSSNGGGNSSRAKTSSKGKKSIYTNLAVTSSTDPTVKHYKPNFTYHELITHEIKRSFEGRLQLSEIYRRISERYPYFKLGEPGWQNSIRHNLSLKKCFVRVDRPTDAPSDKSGKGGWWTYVAQGDPDGRGGRKGMSGKGTGEYRKGQTPSDIASRSGSPEDGMAQHSDHLNALGFDEQETITALSSAAYANDGMIGSGPDGLDRPDMGAAGSSYVDQAQTLAMAAHALNGYQPEQQLQNPHQQLQGGPRH